ncbi:hypothetical protein [Aminobacter carboxidus]|uniref:Uncharacterized protein n=1 Tax=Aminobacter carboxidus TaxID=376165 RepID=A0A8E1WH58_9HYPH|nr:MULTISPECIES: hypothetical protein [Aminobacter carboxidus group]MBB6468826.1 hypothetical protein [Aminobacter lissarensis]MBE1206191.1 hypothetical protein [Aminobacter carboxidus]
MNAMPAKAGMGCAISGNANDGEGKLVLMPRGGCSQQVFLSQRASTSRPHRPTDGEQLSALLLAFEETMRSPFCQSTNCSNSFFLNDFSQSKRRPSAHWKLRGRLGQSS